MASSKVPPSKGVSLGPCAPVPAHASACCYEHVRGAATPCTPAASPPCRVAHGAHPDSRGPQENVPLVGQQLDARRLCVAGGLLEFLQPFGSWAVGPLSGAGMATGTRAPTFSSRAREADMVRVCVGGVQRAGLNGRGSEEKSGC